MEGELCTVRRRNERGLVGVDMEGDGSTVRRRNEGSTCNVVRRTEVGIQQSVGLPGMEMEGEALSMVSTLFLIQILT